MKRSALLGTLLLGAALTTACGWNDDDEPPITTQPAIQPAPQPPHLDPLSVPEWPPMGPSARIGARCTDETDIRNVTAHFKWSRSRMAKNGQAISFSGDELGEGQGDLRIVCCDLGGACAERNVNNLIVDLTPPEIAPERLVASPLRDGFDGDVSLWVRDAWVLGSVELTFAGTTLRHELPKVYPSTVGTDWDISRVTFPAHDLPAGTGMARIVARDAAGNATVQEVELRIDATPPKVAILAPAQGTAVTGSSFTVKLQASDDDNPKPTKIALWVGGTRVADLDGPLAEIDVDTSTLPAGPTEVRAVSRDDAGNESIAAKVVVQVP